MKRHCSFVLAIAVSSIVGLAAASGQVPSPRVPDAVIADTPRHPTAPAQLAVLTFPSHGADLDATFYLAAGDQPHGTVILLHGLPGYEINGDLAQSIRRAGWNVLLFHYRGTWGARGKFSISSAIEDTAAALRFLREPVTAKTYRVDIDRLVLIGHSFGGFLAGLQGSRDPQVAAVGMITAVNLGRINADAKEREIRLKRWQTQLHPVRGASARQLFAEAARHSNGWDYVRWDSKLYDRPTLVVAADDQNRAEMNALAAALQKRGSTSVRYGIFQTDHSFSDQRIGLQAIVVDWLQHLSAVLGR